MRFKPFLFTSIGLIASPFVSSALALDLEALLPPEDGASICWQRDYDDAHLASHPEQRVTRMRLSIDYFVMEPMDEGRYGFGLDVQRRGEPLPGGAAGICHDVEGGISCYVECDGGSFLLREASRPESVLLDMRDPGFLRLRECGEDGPTISPLTPGKDDEVFLLRRTDASACAVPFGR